MKINKYVCSESMKIKPGSRGSDPRPSTNIVCSHVNGMLALYIKSVWAMVDSMWLIASVRLCVRVHLHTVCSNAHVWARTYV